MTAQIPRNSNQHDSESLALALHLFAPLVHELLFARRCSGKNCPRFECPKLVGLLRSNSCLKLSFGLSAKADYRLIEEVRRGYAEFRTLSTAIG